jgi:hypothetical protein
MFSYVPYSSRGETGKKSVTVIVPATATDWDGIIDTYSGAEKTGGTYWGEGFRGRGWEKGAYVDDEYYSVVNENISLTIKREDTP